MIIQFSVTNYGCFRDRQTFSMLASQDVTQTPEAVSTVSLPGLKGESLLKGATLFGGNSTGKSTFFRAFLQLRRLILFSDIYAEDMPEIQRIPGYTPFVLNSEMSSEPSLFELDFLVQRKRFKYRIAFTKQSVVEESLVAFSGTRPKKWYRRVLNSHGETDEYSWSFSREFDQSDVKLRERTRSEVAYLAVAGRWNHPQLRPVKDWFSGGVFFYSGKELQSSDVTASLLKSPARKKEALSLLSYADPSIVGISVRYKDPKIENFAKSNPHIAFSPNEKNAEIVLQVRGENGVSYPLQFSQMSDGTNRYAFLLGPILDVLEKGGVLLVDELETSLHPMLLYKLVGLFMSEKTNPKGAQLIFSTHMSSLFSASADPFGDEPLLRRDQFWFTEKMHDGSSVLYPLTRYQPQENEALERRYLAGRYGGIPLLPEGDLP